MPPRHPSQTSLLLAWFFLSPIVVMVVAAIQGRLVAGIVAAAGYVILFALFAVWRERTTNADAALSGLRGLSWAAHPRRKR
jgi:hypothetical protein